MGQIDLQGALFGGPPTGGSTFPAATFSVPLRMSTTPKPFGVATGVLTRNVASPAAYLTLSGIGAADTVTKGDVLYFKASGAVDLRLTTDDGAGGDVVAIVPVQGIVILEFSSSKYLKLVEVQGSASIEYFMSGQS